MANSSIPATTATRSRSSGKALLAACLIGTFGSASAAPRYCPPTLTVEQHAVDLPAGTKTIDAEPRHNWTGVQFSDGPPEERAWLAPESHRKSKNDGAVGVWSFTPSTGGIWLACGYAGTSVMTVTRLPDGVKSCRVHYDTGFSPEVATTVDCE